MQAVFYSLDTAAPYGTYNLTGSGAVKGWVGIAKDVFDQTNGNAEKVLLVTTERYYANAAASISPRPANSDLSLAKIGSTGYRPVDRKQTLKGYVQKKKRSQN
ncbi:dTDP-4-dehydrorhamnose 3,5-epimerase [Bifidobacterium commune]|nr:dTDP-4-dehydrorhamnose 3,5-epimerase [Bifidobacterium commune]